MKITEGYMPYLEYKTYYRIVGECTGNKKPLLLLHGGPGSTHNYFEMLDKLAEDGVHLSCMTSWDADCLQHPHALICGVQRHGLKN